MVQRGLTAEREQEAVGIRQKACSTGLTQLRLSLPA
jgi:hypothetical protein